MNSEKPHGGRGKSLALSFYTLLSRILGLVRDHYMAITFGTGLVASAFSVAYRFPNMYRNLLAEGTLSQSFMPIYSEAEKKSKEEAAIVSGTVITFLFTMLSIFVSVFALLAPFFIPFLVGGTPQYSDLVIKLSLILFFLIMTASLASIFMAILNNFHKYFIPSLSPIILNISYLIVFIFIIPNETQMVVKATTLAYGIICGGVTQLFVQAYFVYKMGIFPNLNFNWKHNAIKKIFSLMVPAVVGGGFYQISLLIDIFLANYIQNQNPGLGAVVSLDYSQRLIQFPTGIIGVALATTTLPTLLSALKADKKESIPQELVNVICFTLFLTLPAALGFLIMGRSIIDSIYFGGKWDNTSTDSTLYALQFYSMAIPIFSLNKILTSSFYAFQDTKTPLKSNIIAFIVNLGSNLILIGFLKHAGLALSSAISALFTFVLLYRNLNKLHIKIPTSILIKKLMKFVPSMITITSSLLILQVFFYSMTILYLEKIGISHANSSRLFLSFSIIISCIFYFTSAKLMNLEEFDIIFGKVLQKLRSKKS